jgi:hypothetical protein
MNCEDYILCPSSCHCEISLASYVGTVFVLGFPTVVAKLVYVSSAHPRTMWAAHGSLAQIST